MVTSLLLFVSLAYGANGFNMEIRPSPRDGVRLVNSGKSGLAFRLEAFLMQVDPRYRKSLDKMLERPFREEKLMWDAPVSPSDHLTSRLMMGYTMETDYEWVYSVVAAAVKNERDENKAKLGQIILHSMTRHIPPAKFEAVTQMAQILAAQIAHDGIKDIEPIPWPQVNKYSTGEIYERDERFIYMDYPLTFNYNDVLHAPSLKHLHIISGTSHGLAYNSVALITKHFSHNMVGDSGKHDYNAMVATSGAFLIKLNKVLNNLGAQVLKEIKLRIHPAVFNRLLDLIEPGRKVIHEP